MASKFKRIEAQGSRLEVERLFMVAKANAIKNPNLSNRSVVIARKLASKNRISLRKYNRLHCRKCAVYFTSNTLRVRTTSSSVVYSCLSCNHVTRIRTK